MTRAFAAIFPPPHIAEALSDLVERLRGRCHGVKWVEKENMHLTLRFFGDLSDEQITAAGLCMSELSQQETSFSARMGTVGCFPSVSRARVIWVGVDEGREQLARLAGALDEKFAAAGLGQSDKPFSAHLTVGRVRAPRRNPELEEAIRSLTFPEGEFIIDSLTLTRSELTPKGPIYSPLSVARLRVAE
ncbi:MAG: RNA 2',3'-cyclic phosphodiesterase [Candidatus Eiseniibacteriota bacterium]|nr:MAG: RNA 2',3'-cyclic phosphodiesterase [Candidatus Eisenbacteria bacterium]